MEKIITIINRVGTKKHQLNGVEYTSTAIGIEWIGRCRHLPPPILIFLHCNTPISSISQIHSESLYKNNSLLCNAHLLYGWKWLIHPITPIMIIIQNTTSHIVQSHIVPLNIQVGIEIVPNQTTQWIKTPQSWLSHESRVCIYFLTISFHFL